MKYVVLRFITMPMAIQIFKQDKESFAASKVNMLYEDLFDSILNKLQNDFKKLKADMYSKHHMDVRYIGKENGMVKYSVNRSITEFTPEELRSKTGELMREYLANVGIERQDYV